MLLFETRTSQTVAYITNQLHETASPEVVLD
jgi:hypothetical protein